MQIHLVFHFFFFRVILLQHIYHYLVYLFIGQWTHCEWDGARSVLWGGRSLTWLRYLQIPSGFMWGSDEGSTAGLGSPGCRHGPAERGWTGAGWGQWGSKQWSSAAYSYKSHQLDLLTGCGRREKERNQWWFQGLWLGDLKTWSFHFLG